jgi:uncharacterized protein involved in exopolysaccharide biosynthesis
MELKTIESRLTPPSLEDLFVILFKRKWSIVFISFVTIFATLFWLGFVREDLYKTQAKILVKAGVEQGPPSTAVTPVANTVGYRSADVKSEIDILHSSHISEVLVDKYHMDQVQPEEEPKETLRKIRFRVKHFVRGVRKQVEEVLIMAGLKERLTPREVAIAGLQMGLQVEAIEGSNTVQADLYLPFRKGSGAVLNALLEEYQTYRKQVYADTGSEYFKKEMTDRADALHAAEQELNEFESNAAITDQPKQKALLLDQVLELERKRNDAEVEFHEAEERMKRVTAELKDGQLNYAAVGKLEGESFPREVLNEIATLAKDREKLLLTEIDGSDRVKNVESQLTVLGNMLRENLQSVAAEKRSRYESLRNEADSARMSIDMLHGAEVQWLDLRRKAEVLNQEYNFYRAKYEETTVARTSLDQKLSGNIVVIESALDPQEAAGLSKLTYIGIGLFAALLAALGYVTMAEFFDQRVYTTVDLERSLGAPVLLAIPYDRRLARLKGATFRSTGLSPGRKLI